MTGLVTIKEAKTRRELVRFMQYPLKLYKGNNCYVPDILSSQVADMQKKKNPAFDYCDAVCYLAYRDGKIVGRIAGIHNRRANEKFQKNYLTVSHLDFIDDDEVVDALFAAVSDWGRARGCVAVHGPLGFSDMDREGMLIEGYDRLSLFYTYYNYPYYAEHMQRMGFEKEADWMEYRVKLPDELPPRLRRIADEVRKRHHFEVADLGNMGRSLKELAHDFFTLYNETYRVLFGMVPLTDKQVVKYQNEFLPLIDERTTVFLYDDKDEMIAFGICCPSLDDAQRANRGRMFPFGWVPMLRALKGRNDTLDMLLISVKPELQGSGLTAVLMVEMYEKLYKAGFRFAETGPQLEENTRVRMLWKFFEAEQHKRRRCWQKAL